MYHKAVKTVAQRMKRLGEVERMAEREIKRFHKHLDLEDPIKIQRYETLEMWQCSFAMSSQRAKHAGVEPTIKEKMQLESLKQNPTVGRIVEGHVIKKLFTEDEDEDNDNEEDDKVTKKQIDTGEDCNRLKDLNKWWVGVRNAFPLFFSSSGYSCVGVPV